MPSRSARHHMVLVFAILISGCAGNDGAALETWVSSPETRFLPGSYSRDLSSRTLSLEALRNETISAQIGTRAPSDGHRLSVRVSPLRGPAALAAETVRVRFPGYVLVDEVGGFVSDPLLEDPDVELLANRAQAIWLTLAVPASAEPGLYKGEITLLLDGRPADRFELELKVLEAALPDPVDYHFFLNILQDAYSIARWYEVPLWSEAHFDLIRRYAQNLARHGQQSVTTSIVTNSWRDNGIEFNRLPTMIDWRYPGDWESKGGEHFTFDFSVFDRYVEIHTELGIGREITCLSPVIGPGSSPDSEIGYLDTASSQQRSRTVQVGSTAYAEAWSDFAKAFEAHLREKGWLDITYLLLDEKPGEVVEEIRRVFRRAAPDLQLNISGSSGPMGEQNRLESDQWVLIYDELFDTTLVPPGTAAARRERGQITLFYTACGENHPNTFIYSPLRESRMLPWVAARHDVDGYIRWAWNLWPQEVWEQPHFRWPSGDMFFVYPGKEGPIDSTRWEMLHQGIQDVEALRLLRERWADSEPPAEVKAEVDALLRQSNAVHSCRGVSPIGPTARARINELLAESGG